MEEQGLATLIQTLIDRIDALDKKFSNHLPSLIDQIAKNTNDISWLKKFFWVAAGLVIVQTTQTIITTLMGK